jgi:fluoride exporter
MIWTLIQVAFGGAIGSVLRVLTLQLVNAPIGTALVNVLGSFAMGGLFVAMRQSPLLMTGVLGGFTTFSAFSLDALKLYRDGQPTQALLYAAGSVLFSLAAVAFGAAVAQRALT